MPYRASRPPRWGVDFNPNGSMLAIGGQNNTVTLWSWADRRPLAPPFTFSPGNDAAIGPVAFHPNGKNLAFSDGAKNIILWDVKTRQPINPPLEGTVGRIHDLFESC